jgi:hypothetical protein
MMNCYPQFLACYPQSGWRWAMLRYQIWLLAVPGGFDSAGNSDLIQATFHLINVLIQFDYTLFKGFPK